MLALIVSIGATPLAGSAAAAAAGLSMGALPPGETPTQMDRASSCGDGVADYFTDLSNPPLKMQAGEVYVLSGNPVGSLTVTVPARSRGELRVMGDTTRNRLCLYEASVEVETKPAWRGSAFTHLLGAPYGGSWQNDMFKVSLPNDGSTAKTGQVTFRATMGQLRNVRAELVLYDAIGKRISPSPKLGYDVLENPPANGPIVCNGAAFSETRSGTADHSLRYIWAPAGTVINMTVEARATSDAGDGFFFTTYPSGGGRVLFYPDKDPVQTTAWTARETGYQLIGIHRIGSGSGAETFTGTFTITAVKDGKSQPCVTAPEPRPGKYVSLGDSFASGEGLGDYITDSKCHRSNLAFANFIKVPGSDSTFRAASSADPGVQWGFQACASAKTENFLYRRQADKKEPLTQLASDRSADSANPYDLPVDAETTLVTISIGGNDLGYSKVLKRCLVGSRDCPESLKEGEWTQFETGVAAILRQIRNKAPGARILLLGYPLLFPATPAEQTCTKLRVFPQENQRRIRALVAQVNLRLGLLATAARQNGVNVDYLPVAEAFRGHEICGADGEWVNGPSVSWRKSLVDDYSFHPNAAGHRDGYAAVINSYLKENVL